jgi:hypothetical protein
MAAALDLKSSGEIRVGSSPSSGTQITIILNLGTKRRSCETFLHDLSRFCHASSNMVPH